MEKYRPIKEEDSRQGEGAVIFWEEYGWNDCLSHYSCLDQLIINSHLQTSRVYKWAIEGGLSYEGPTRQRHTSDTKLGRERRGDSHRLPYKARLAREVRAPLISTTYGLTPCMPSL